MPASCRTLATVRRVATRSPASRAEKDSSSSMSSGSRARARASATRCCWPPEISCGRRAASAASSETISSSSATLACVALRPFGSREVSMPKAMF